MVFLAVVPAPSSPVRLGAHVLAHLRAVAEGVSPSESARRYLVDGDAEGAALAAHQGTAAAAALLARRAGLGSRWRLLRMGRLPAAALAAPVDLDAWAEVRGYTDFSHDELVHAYENEVGILALDRKARQIERLRLARLALLSELEAFRVAPPSLASPVGSWFPEQLAARLRRAGFHTLGELRTAIALGGRWWRGLPAYGPLKAQALADQVVALVGWPAPPAWQDVAAARARAATAEAWIEDWIAKRTESQETARAYRREAQRFLMWLAVERRRSLAEATDDDCRAYIAFLRAVPTEWMSRRGGERFGPGWAPFSRQPGIASQRYALGLLNAFAAWLVRAGRLARNPWEMVNLRLGDDPGRLPDHSRAFTAEAWTALSSYLDSLPASARARMTWLLAFGQATGLRAAELVRATRGDLAPSLGGMWLSVFGKGARRRSVPVPRPALGATRAYFAARGLDFDTAAADTPLLAALDGFSPLTYSTLAKAFKRFALAALAASTLPFEEREAGRRASLHWLRHTHGTRAAERGVDADVQQANMGHADPRTTARYARAQERRRMEQIEAAFGAE